MTEMHRPYRSTQRMAFLSALLFGALMVLGLAVFPQQSADAAPKPKGVRCTGGVSMVCGKIITVGDTVAATKTIGKVTCKYLMTVKKVTPATRDGVVVGGLVEGEVTAVTPEIDCLELGVYKGQKDLSFSYTLKAKGGGKKK